MAKPQRALTPVPSRRVMVASATRVRIDQKEEVRKALSLKEDWQKLAWDYYDAVDPVKFATNVLANVLSKLRLFAAIDPEDPDGEPVVDDDPEAIAAVNRLRGETGGHAELLRSLGIHLSVPGQCWLVGLAARGGEEPTPERWFIASTEEIKKKGADGVAVEDPDTGADIVLRGQNTTPIGEEPDFWARIWRRHPRKSSKADSSLRGVLSACEELLIVDRAFRSIERSRISFGKLLYVPDDISFGSTDPTTDVAGDGEAIDDPFNAELLEFLTTPIQDEGSAAAVAPGVMRGPRAEGGSGIEVINVDRATTDTLLDDRGDKALKRIARGMDLPPELYFGLSEATHWGAGQIEKQEFRQHVEPLAILAVDALTIAYYRPALRAAGMDEAEVAQRRVWFEASAVVVDPIQQTSASEGHDRFVLSDDAWRRVKGFGDDDAPTVEEIQRRILQDQARRGTQANVPDLPVAGIPAEPQPPTTEPPPQPINAAALQRAVMTDLARQLVDVDRALKARLEAALDATLRRALQKIGIQLRNRARKDERLAQLVAGVPNESVAATLGPAHVSALGGIPPETAPALVDELRRRFNSWVFSAQSHALGVVPRLDPASRRLIEDEQAADREEAWLWLRQRMIELVNARVYDPHPEADEEGEVDADVTVPFGIVREAVARAGGAGRATSAVVAAGELAPEQAAQGIGTGPVVNQALRQGGIRTEGFQWEYGMFPRSRPFPPHQRLSGVQFVHFDDEALKNPTGGWPGPFYVPGDHKGCKCDFVPVLIETAPVGLSLADVFASWASALTEAQLSALNGYQGAAFRGVNEQLRSGVPLSEIEGRLNAEDLASAIAKGALPQDTTVYRGLEDFAGVFGANDEAGLVGMEFVDRGFLSTSLDQEQARRFVGSRYRTGGIVEIQMPEGTPAAHIPSVGTTGQAAAEQEILFGPGGSFRITGYREQDIGSLRPLRIITVEPT